MASVCLSVCAFVCPHDNFQTIKCRTPANFNGFRVLASLLHRCRSTEVSQTLHDVWPSPGLVHIYISGGCCPLGEFFQVQNSVCVQVLRSLILAALLHGTRVVGVSEALGAFGRGYVTTIFDRMAITLGICPHSSFCLIIVLPSGVISHRCWLWLNRISLWRHLMNDFHLRVAIRHNGEVIGRRVDDSKTLLRQNRKSHKKPLEKEHTVWRSAVR